MTEISIDQIRFVKELYPRLKPHDDVIERYRDALDQLPPIVVARGWKVLQSNSLKGLPHD